MSESSGCDPQCDPLRRFQLWLPEVDHWPAEHRPEFTFRRISGREQPEFARIIDRLTPMEFEAARDELYRVVSIGLLDWRNQSDPTTGESVPFDLQRLPDIITTQEAFVLIEERVQACTLRPRQKKVSD